ncbi:MAG: pro-sigmaK processing inhibitor BofA family protein [Clostridia bacterium]|nr:pro-sigmaK processing inhibitor BofA family protein [Clostridia bacterium]
MFVFLMCLCGLVILFTYIKSGRFFRSLFLSVFYGVSALFAVNFIGGFTGLHISVNLFSLLVSSLSGLPGVIFLVVTDLISRLS